MYKILSIGMQTVICIYCMFISHGVNIIFAEDHTISVQQFIDEACVSWEKLSQEYKKGLEISFIYSTPKESVKADVSISGKNELGIVYSSGLLDVVNSHYAFRLERDDDNSPWLVSNIWDNPDKSKENSQSFHGLLSTTAYAYEPIMVEGGWVRDLIKTNDLEITSLKKHKIDDSKNEYVELYFRCQYRIDKYTKIREGRILFDYNNYWVIKEYSVETEFLADEPPVQNNKKNIIATTEKQFEYQNIDGIPFPKTIRATYNIKSETGKNAFNFPDNNFTNIDYKIINNGQIKDDVFYLKYYGFSEPSNPAKRGNIIRFVFMTAGIVLIVLGLYLRRRAS